MMIFYDNFNWLNLQKCYTVIFQLCQMSCFYDKGPVLLHYCSTKDTCDPDFSTLNEYTGHLLTMPLLPPALSTSNMQTVSARLLAFYSSVFAT